MLNKAMVIGRLGQDPEARYMPDGTAVVNVSVATTEKWKDKTGEMNESTEWHRISLYGRLAEIVGQYLHKGDLAYFEGKLKTRKWTDKEGVEKYTTEINAYEMKMLQTKGGDGGEQREQSAQKPLPATQAAQQRYGEHKGSQRAPAARPGAAGSGFDDMDDDIPFATSSPTYDMTTRKQRRMERYTF